MKLVETVEIDATARLVWQVIVDLDRYAEWNPFVVAAESTLKPGEPIRMKVQLFERFRQPQTETILEHEPGRRLCYGLAASLGGALHSHRCHDVEPLSEARSAYTSSFELDGWLSPLVAKLMGRRLERGFAGNTAGLKARAQSLAGAAAR